MVTEEGPTGLWQRTLGTLKSYFPGGAREDDYERLPSRRDEHKETPSARFALFSVEVRLIRVDSLLRAVCDYTLKSALDSRMP